MTARVYRDPAPLAPASPRTGTHRVVRGEELRELVDLRGLLCELRPGERHDTTGPLAWSPLAHAPEHREPPQGALARRIRVQTSVGPSDGPKEAFASLASVSPGVESDARVRAVAAEGGEEPARTLTWLQRSGTVVDGLPALCVAAAVALAPEPLVERWAKLSATLATERRRQWGLAAVLYALRWWRGERPVCCAQGADCATGFWALSELWAWGAECREVAARCLRPEKVRVKGSRCGRCA